MHSLIFLGNGKQGSNLSWWPKQQIFKGSGLNVGYWSAGCEEWFQRRLKMIQDYITEPRQTTLLKDASEWRRSLGFRGEAKKISKYNNMAAARYLQGEKL